MEQHQALAHPVRGLGQVTGDAHPALGVFAGLLGGPPSQSERGGRGFTPAGSRVGSWLDAASAVAAGRALDGRQCGSAVFHPSAQYSTEYLAPLAERPWAWLNLTPRGGDKPAPLPYTFLLLLHPVYRVGARACPRPC